MAYMHDDRMVDTSNDRMVDTSNDSQRNMLSVSSHSLQLLEEDFCCYGNIPELRTRLHVDIFNVDGEGNNQHVNDLLVAPGCLTHILK